MANKRGNQGYGKVQAVKKNFDKFSPVFWKLMGELSKSADPNDKRLFIVEFNKIQVKMIPQAISDPEGNAISGVLLLPARPDISLDK